MRLYVEHHLSCAKSDHPAAMTLPREIGDAAQNGDRDRVMAWLDAGGSIDDVDTGGYTLLNCCAVGDKENELIIGDRQVALARHLITLGADVNVASKGVGFTPLYIQCIAELAVKVQWICCLFYSLLRQM